MLQDTTLPRIRKSTPTVRSGAAPPSRNVTVTRGFNANNRLIESRAPDDIGAIKFPKGASWRIDTRLGVVIQTSVNSEE